MKNVRKEFSILVFFHFFSTIFFASVSVLRLGVLPGWAADYNRVSYVKHSKEHASDGLREAKSSKRGAFS